MGVPKAEGGTPRTIGPINPQGQSQNDFHLPDVPRSDRWGQWVYYPRGNKQCRRRYVVPRDPRTPGQLRSRAALGAASKAWTESSRLTPADRQAWIAAGAKVQSRVRLGQSGPLTGQQHFVGRNCETAQLGLDLLLRPEAKRELRPLPIPPSSFYKLHSAFRPRPWPIYAPVPVQPRHSPHVDRFCPTYRHPAKLRLLAPQLRLPTPKLRCRARRRQLWRGS
jgi:hypothetical protein